MLEFVWFLIGSAITLAAVLVVVQVRLRQDRLLAAQEQAAAPPEPCQVVVADNRSLETVALGVGQELASLASSVEGHAQLLCERSGRSGQVIEKAEGLWESVRRLRFFTEKMQAFAKAEEAVLRPARVTPVLRAVVHEIEDYAGGSLEVALNAARSLPMALVDTRNLRRALLFLTESVLCLEPNTPGLTISAQTELNEDMDAEVLIEIQAESEELVDGANTNTTDIRFSYVAARNLLEAQGAWVSLTHRPGLSVVASVSLKATMSSESPRSAASPAVPALTAPLSTLAISPSTADSATDSATDSTTDSTTGSVTGPTTGHEFGGILVLDRNPGIREMLTAELRRLGRHVIACDEGRAAELLYAATPERFELLILEQDARRLSGEALAAQALASRQDVRVILLTSKPQPAPAASTATLAADPRCTRIPKPFGLMELRSMISEVLGAGTRAEAEASLDGRGG